MLNAPTRCPHVGYTQQQERRGCETPRENNSSGSAAQQNFPLEMRLWAGSVFQWGRVSFVSPAQAEPPVYINRSCLISFFCVDGQYFCLFVAVAPWRGRCQIFCTQKRGRPETGTGLVSCFGHVRRKGGRSRRRRRRREGRFFVTGLLGVNNAICKLSCQCDARFPVSMSLRVVG